MAETRDLVKGVALLGVLGVGGYVIYDYFASKPEEAEGGDLVSLKFKWRNIGPSAINAHFRLDLRRDVPLATWNEGDWIYADYVEPDQISEELTVSKKIPDDWPSGLNIPPNVSVDVRLMAELPDGEKVTLWQKDKALIVR